MISLSHWGMFLRTVDLSKPWWIETFGHLADSYDAKYLHIYQKLNFGPELA